MTRAAADVGDYVALMTNRTRTLAILGFLLALPAGFASASPGGGGEGGGPALRPWCKGGTILDVRDSCGTLIYQHCVGGRDSGQIRQFAMACD
jgi:hypothetical protein